MKTNDLCTFFSFYFVVTKTFLYNYADKENSSLTNGVIETKFSDVAKPPEGSQQSKRTILDLYSGCGAMSSGLSIGASLAGENIVTVKKIGQK